MRKYVFHGSHDCRPLPDVIRELVERLLADDWCRFSTEDGSRFYYVIGDTTYIEHSADCNSMEFPKGRSPRWQGPRPQIEKYLRGLAAGPHPDYVGLAVKRLKEVGIPDVATAQKLLQRLQDHSSWDKVPGQQFLALCNYLDALCAQHMVAAEHPEEEEEGELAAAREKLYLREVSKKYNKLVAKLHRLPPLTFEDRQLEEATRCWLYGFYRAAVILSASALEECLKGTTNTDRVETYRELVEEARKQGKLPERHAQQAEVVFNKRNRVVHEAWRPEPEETENVLALARGVIGCLHQQG